MLILYKTIKKSKTFIAFTLHYIYLKQQNNLCLF